MLEATQPPEAVKPVAEAAEAPTPAEPAPPETTLPEVAPAPETAAPAKPPPAPPAAPAPAETAPPINFSSRRATDKAGAPSLGGATRDLPPARPAAREPEGLGKGDVAAARIPVEPERPAFVAAPAADPPTPAPRAGFLSRRRAKPAPPPEPVAARPKVIPAAPATIPQAPVSEQERMTIFGARRTEVGGKPRFLGLILTAALLVFLAGVAAWASVFLDDGLSFSRLFGDRDRGQQFSEDLPADPAPAPAIAATQPPAPDPAPEVLTASLTPTLTEEDSAVLDALREPAQPVTPDPPTEAELEAQYAATGIWPVAPVVPPDPAGQIDLDDLYLTSIDPVSTSADAIALPLPESFVTDRVLAAVATPPPAGTTFALGADGLVIPTAQGALSPDGFTVFRGRPPLVPPATPTRFQSEPEDTVIRSALAAIRPQPRPSDLVENTERAQLDGLTRSELATIRPELRPPSMQQQAEEAAAAEVPPVSPEATNGAVALALAAPSPFDNPTAQAIQASRRPDVRPRNFARIVKRAERSQPQEEDVRVASAATVAPRAVQPNIPSKTSVAKQATVKNALNLRKINLIGVYGKPSNRRALVRLDNGRYQKVVVGDRLDGGRVSAIGDSELRYTKRGRDMVLKMPR